MLLVQATNTPSPGPGYAPCYICGSATVFPNNNDAIVQFPGQPPVTCGSLQLGGITGFVEPTVCSVFRQYGVPQICDCPNVNTTMTTTTNNNTNSTMTNKTTTTTTTSTKGENSTNRAPVAMMPSSSTSQGFPTTTIKRSLWQNDDENQPSRWTITMWCRWIPTLFFVVFMVVP